MISAEEIKWFDRSIQVRVIGKKKLVKVKDACDLVGSEKRFYGHYYPRVTLYRADGTVKRKRHSTTRTYINLNEIFHDNT